MKVIDVIRSFFNFDLSNWGFLFKIWKYPSDVNNTICESTEACHGKVPEKYNNKHCCQVYFDANERTATFFCSENDEDW